MGISTKIISDVSAIIDAQGTSVTVYVSPTYTLDDEGGATISKGTATTGKAIVFSEGVGEEFSREEEGVEDFLVYTMYLKSTIGTLTKTSLIYYNTEYYRIVAMKKHPLEDEPTTMYQLTIERMADQSSVS